MGGLMPEKTTIKTITIIITMIYVFILTWFMGKAHADGIIYDQNKKLLTVHAETTSFMAILHDVAAKTGIKITIGGGVIDKYVTMNRKQLHISHIDDLLDASALRNRGRHKSYRRSGEWQRSD